MAQEAAQLRPGGAVDRGEALVQEQQGRFGGDVPGERHPLGLAAGEHAWAGGGELGEPDALQPLGCPPPCFGAGDMAGPQPERDVFEDAEVGEEQVVLEHHADVAVLGVAGAGWTPCHRPAVRR